MAEDGLFRLAGAPEPAPDKYTSIASIRLTAGYQTQRNPLMSIDNRYAVKFLGARPDVLWAGTNIEVSNRLTLQRRPGVVPYGVSNIPAPTNFFDWQLATTADIVLVVDTKTSGGDNNAGANGAVFNYSPTHSGIYFNKALNSKQANFIDIVNTMYVGDGVDLYKVIGPNLLYQSNTFGTGSGTNFSVQSPWAEANVFALTPGQSDPVGGASASQLIWSTSGPSAALVQAHIVPNYTPIASNTFTFSMWMKRTGGPISITMQLADQSGNQAANATFALATTWVKYQITGTMLSTATELSVNISNPTTTNTMVIYGAQLEVGGPASTTQITTTRPQGVYLWGIQAPTSLPNAIPSTAVLGNPWVPNTLYTTKILALTSVTSGTGVYAGTITGGAANAFAGQFFTVAGFSNTSNNSGTNPFVCTASTTTHLTLTNPASIAETNTATATPTVALTSVTAAGVYSGTITGGGGNVLGGYATTIKGFNNSANNGTFFISSSTNSSLATQNVNAVAETTAAHALILGQAITDSNGNLEVATETGTSGSTTPAWNISTGATTFDGLQNVFIIQTAENSGSSTTAATTLPNPVTANNSLLAFIAVNRNTAVTATVSDGVNTYVLVQSANSGPFTINLYVCYSAAGGSTTATATCAGAQGTWLGMAEVSNLTATDGVASNTAASIPSGSSVFFTGAVNNLGSDDLLISFTCIVAGNHGSSNSTTPNGFLPILSQSGVNLSQGNGTIAAAFQFLNAPTVTNPQWAVNFANGGSRELGITAAFAASPTATLIWTNFGPLGLTALIGYTYYYAFMNSQTGHVSNVSPISTSTGVIAGQSVKVTGAGMQITPSGPYSQDPQVDTIALFRNTNGGGFWYQLATFPNPGTVTNPGTWTYTDTTPSRSLNTAIFAPIGLLNSPPPSGMVNMEYFAGRMWGSVGNFLYYNTAADNATLLNITQNGVPAESWAAGNNIPFNAPIVRSLAVGGGLLVATTLDTWFVTGQNLLTGGFNPVKAFANHGLRSYNAICLDGSTIYMYTSDRQVLMINPASGSVEIGYDIGDLLETTFSPLGVFLARHVSGSQDNALYMADGSTGWYRMNPNQQGASMSGEQTPVWSPKADFSASIGGIGAIASMETSAGVIQLLVGQSGFSSSGIPIAGPVLVRNLTTFSDNGVPYQWDATFGSILLATVGKLAETESVTVEQSNYGGTYLATQCSVAVLLDEISGAFESLPASVNDPPQLTPSLTVLANRYYLSQGAIPPICRHIQIKLTGGLTSGLPASTRDEMLALTVRGALVNEQVA